MHDLDEFDQELEKSFGLISGYILYSLHQVCKACGSDWDLDKPSTIEIPVTKENAVAVYSHCKEIRSGYSVGLSRGGMKKIKEARMKAHLFLVEEANDPNTPIDRKIELVRLTSRTKIDKNF